MVANLFIGIAFLVVDALLLLRVGNDVGTLLHERARILADGFLQFFVHLLLSVYRFTSEVVLLFCGLALAVLD